MHHVRSAFDPASGSASGNVPEGRQPHLSSVGPIRCSSRRSSTTLGRGCPAATDRGDRRTNPVCGRRLCRSVTFPVACRADGAGGVGSFAECPRPAPRDAHPNPAGAGSGTPGRRRSRPRTVVRARSGETSQRQCLLLRAGEFSRVRRPQMQPASAREASERYATASSRSRLAPRASHDRASGRTRRVSRACFRLSENASVADVLLFQVPEENCGGLELSDVRPMECGRLDDQPGMPVADRGTGLRAIPSTHPARMERS